MGWGVSYCVPKSGTAWGMQQILQQLKNAWQDVTIATCLCFLSNKALGLCLLLPIFSVPCTSLLSP
jgi:hypothetical protein